MTVTSRSLNAPCVLVPGVAPLTRVTASCTRALSRAPLSDISASLHAIVAAGKIELIAPARASHFNENGRSIVLEDGRNVPADAVVLATGWKNSWDGIFDGKSFTSTVHNDGC